MRISVVGQQNCNFAKGNLGKTKNFKNQNDLTVNKEMIAFKGGKGGAVGILAGAAVGALGAAAIIATGGLAGAVAAIGYGSTVAAGAASCTHIGGIAGSIIEDKLEGKK